MHGTGCITLETKSEQLFLYFSPQILSIFLFQGSLVENSRYILHACFLLFLRIELI